MAVDDFPSWSWKDEEMPVDTAVVEVKNPHTPEAYDAWLARGKALAADHNDRQWLLGDWLNEGDDSYNVQNLGIPSYLLIGAHTPNFWKDVSAEVDLAVGTLKNLALVARRFPPDKRITVLSWSHHMVCAPYERRYEYALACLDVPEGKKPRSLGWLQDHIAANEVEPETKERVTVPLRLPVSVIKKLKEVARHHGKHLDKVVYDACASAIHDYLVNQEREISLEIYGRYDEGVWPFQTGAIVRYEQAKAYRRKR